MSCYQFFDGIKDFVVVVVNGDDVINIITTHTCNVKWTFFDGSITQKDEWREKRLISVFLKKMHADFINSESLFEVWLYLLSKGVINLAELLQQQLTYSLLKAITMNVVLELK